MSATVAYITTPASLAYTAVRTFMRVVSVAVLAIVVAAIVSVGVAPLILGAVPLVVLTQSMEPTIRPGDTVVVKPDATYGIGDIVTYQRTSGKADYVTHRVVGKSFVNGQSTLITQGDNNNAPDEPIKSEQVRGAVLYTVPKVGYLTDSLRQNPLWTSLALTGVVILAAALVPARKSRRTPYAPAMIAAETTAQTTKVRRRRRNRALARTTTDARTLGAATPNGIPTGRHGSSHTPARALQVTPTPCRYHPSSSSHIPPSKAPALWSRSST